MVKANFKEDAKNLGYMAALDSNNSNISLDRSNHRFGAKAFANVERDLKAGSEIELPMWLAVHLAQRDICSL